LYLEGFGKQNMAYADMLSVLQDLVGTPLTSICLNNTQSVIKSNRKINFTLLAIPNLTLTRLAIDNSAESSLEGQLSKIQPSVTSVSLSVSSKYDDAVETLLDTIFFMPNLRLLHIYGYPDMAQFRVTLKSLTDFILDNIDIDSYSRDIYCYMQTRIQISRNLSILSINLVNTLNIPEWSAPLDTLPMCISTEFSLWNLCKVASRQIQNN